MPAKLPIIKTNMKKQHVILIVLILLVAGLGVLAIYKYERTPKGLTLQAAVSQRDTVTRDLQIQKQLEAVHVQAAITTTQKQATAQFNANTTQLCAFITAHVAKTVVLPSECTSNSL
jgi:predicted transcriptional regulator